MDTISRPRLTFLVVILICVDGLIKPDAPGSLQQPASTFLFPENWATLPLSFGLIMCKSDILQESGYS